MPPPLLSLRITVASAMLLATSPATAQLADSAWPMFQHDAQHTGRSDVSGPQGPETRVAWAFKAKSGHQAAPVVGTDGTVYVGNGKLLLAAVDPADGEMVWTADLLSSIGKRKAGQPDRSQPAVAADGTIYQGARDNNLWAIDAGGGIDWFFHVPHDGDVTTSPTIGSDGAIYMGSEALGAGWLYAMNPDGSFKWPDGPNVEDGRVVLRGSLKNVSPALSVDETRLFVSIKREAIALDAATGDEIWRCTIASKGFGSRQPNYSPVVYDDGSGAPLVLFVSKDGLWAFDAEAGPGYDCTPAWLFVPLGQGTEEELKSAPAIGPDGTIYVGASRGKKSSTFYALDPANGSVVWQHEHAEKGTYNNSQAAIGADGTVYVGHGKILYAFDGAGDGTGGSAVLWQMLIRGKMKSGPIVGGDGVLYVGAGKRLYKITD